MVVDTGSLLYGALTDGKHVMFEGAQGVLLDLDHGTYPFVTSSNPVAGSAFASAGIGRPVGRSGGRIMKAYITRVGAGPFPTELLDEMGERLGVRGKELGTVTGRQRRCGWFDACLGRYAARLNGLTELLITKLDVLSGLDTLKICTGYRADGQTFEDMPPHQSVFHDAEPDLRGARGVAGGDRRMPGVRGSAEAGADLRAPHGGARGGARRRGQRRSGPRTEPSGG